MLERRQIDIDIDLICFETFNWHFSSWKCSPPISILHAWMVNRHCVTYMRLASALEGLTSFSIVTFNKSELCVQTNVHVPNIVCRNNECISLNIIPNGLCKWLIAHIYLTESLHQWHWIQSWKFGIYPFILLGIVSYTSMSTSWF